MAAGQLLALKLTSTRRISRVYDIAADPGAALLAALTALPKATALTTYSCRLEHRRQAAFLAALDKAALAAGLAHGEALNLDFHAVMHRGDDPGARPVTDYGAALGSPGSGPGPQTRVPAPGYYGRDGTTPRATLMP